MNAPYRSQAVPHAAQGREAVPRAVLRRRRSGSTPTAGRPSPSPTPRPASVIGTIPNMGAAETRRAIEAADRALPAWRARIAKERAAILRKWFELMMANQDDLGAHHDHRAGQAAGRGERRDRLRRVASSSGSPRKRKRVYGDMIPHASGRQAHRGDQAAGRRVRRDHAVELPDGDDHAQGRRRRWRPAAPWWSSPRRRRRSRRWRWPSWPSAPACRRACSTSSPARADGDRRRADRATRSCARSPSPAPPRSARC